jgi:hypothetical protein
MSQIVRIKKTHMVEREYLTGALEDMGHKWQENARLGLFGRRVDIKIRGMNVGFNKSGSAYEMVMVGGFSVKNRDLLQALIQRYAYQAARAKLEAQGFSLASEEVQQDGRIHLTLRRMA